MMCLWASYMKKHSDPELDPDPLVRGTDPVIRILTKMSRIPNTACNTPPPPPPPRLEREVPPRD
jgi:hypothetical protein